MKNILGKQQAKIEKLNHNLKTLVCEDHSLEIILFKCFTHKMFFNIRQEFREKIHSAGMSPLPSEHTHLVSAKQVSKIHAEGSANVQDAQVRDSLYFTQDNLY